MWSLPHTESNPRRSQSSAVGKMSDGFAKGTGYIIPSMHVGMWTPNRMPGASVELRRRPGPDQLHLAVRCPRPDEHGSVDLPVGRDLVGARRPAERTGLEHLRDHLGAVRALGPLHGSRHDHDRIVGEHRPLVALERGVLGVEALLEVDRLLVLEVPGPER